MGMRLTVDRQSEFAYELVKTLSDKIGAPLDNDSLTQINRRSRH